MRSTIGRVAFRGASRFLSPATSRGAVLATCHPIRSRELCSSSALTSDGVRKGEENDVTTAAKVTADSNAIDGDLPEVEIIAEDTVIPSVENVAKEGIIAGSIEESGGRATASGDTNRVPLPSDAKSDPEAFAKLLSDALQRKAVRSALWYYTNSFKISGQPAIDASVMKMMLPLLGRFGWAPSSMDTLQLAIERDYNLGVGYYNCGLHAISRSGDTKGFTELLDGMWKLPRESHPNASSYTYLIGAYVYRGAVDDAFEVLKDMKKHMIYPTFATYHALITGCLRRRDSQRAYSTLLAVEKQRFDVSAMTVAQVLVSSAQNDDCENVLNLIAKLEEALPRYKAEMHRIAESRATYRLPVEERTTKEDRAEMRGDPKPEVGAISEVLHCAFRNGRADIGMAGWDMLKRHYPDMDVPPSLWYCMIGAFAGAGDFSRAFDVLGAMREAGHKPSIKDLEVALIRPLSFDIPKIDEQFFRLLDRAEKGETEKSSQGETASPSLVPESTQSESSLSDIDSGGESSEVEAQSSQMTSESTDNIESRSGSLTEDSSAKETLADVLSKPDTLNANSFTSEFSPKTVGIEELNCIIASCSFAGDLDRAFQTYDEAESRLQLERNADTFNALLEGCVQVRHVRGGLRILKEMESLGFKVTGSTVQLAVRLLLRGGRLQEALDIVRNVQTDGGVVPMQTYQMLVRNCVRGGAIDHAATVIQVASDAGIRGRALTGRLDMDAINKLRTVVDLEEVQSRGVRKSREAESSEDGSVVGVVDVDPEDNVNLEIGASVDHIGDMADPRDHTEIGKH